MLFNEEIRAIIECLLFITNTPLSVEDIAEITSFRPEEIEETLEILIKESQEAKRGIEVVAIAGGYIYATKSRYKEYIEKMYKPQMNSLSNAALETLAIVAYKQPVTKGEVELLRGVNVDGTMSTLVNKGLVEEKGRKEVVGRPLLYGTTKQFLQFFGLNSLADLPQNKEQEHYFAAEIFAENFLDNLAEEKNNQSV